MNALNVTALSALTLISVAIGPASAQTPSSTSAPQTKAQAIAVSFNKFKNVSKEKHGVKKEKYLRVQSDPVAKANPEDYSGTYEVGDFGFALHLRVDRSGRVEGDGYEPLTTDRTVRRSFGLKNGRIEGALLTATKVYANGKAETFEGVFMNRTSYESPTDKGVTRFGLGVLGRPVEVSGITLNKFFYELNSQ
jgi:hypothetical protein